MALSWRFFLAIVEQVRSANVGGGVVSVVREVVRADGALALYHGLSASLLMQASYSMVRFAVYDHLKFLYPLPDAQPRYRLHESIIMASAAGALGGLAGNPTDVVNVRMQGDGRLPCGQRRNYKHVIDGLVRIVREEGVLCLWRGAVPNVQRAMVVTTGQLASYDQFKTLLLQHFGRPDTFATHLTAACCSGVLTTCITQPVDVVKTHLMLAAVPGGSMACASQIVQTHGVRGLYRGLLLGFTRLGPQTVLMLLFFERLKVLFPS